MNPSSAVPVQAAAELDPFTRIVIECGCAVSVQEAPEASVSFTDERLALQVHLDVEGDVLRMVQDPESSMPEGRIVVSAPRVTSVTQQGHGPVTVDVATHQRLALVSYGTGSLSATGRCGVLLAALNGEGSMHLQGMRSAHAKLVNRGSGNLHAVVTATCRLDNTGSGSIRLNEHLPRQRALPPEVTKAAGRR